MSSNYTFVHASHDEMVIMLLQITGTRDGQYWCQMNVAILCY